MLVGRLLPEGFGSGVGAGLSDWGAIWDEGSASPAGRVAEFMGATGSRDNSR